MRAQPDLPGYDVIDLHTRDTTVDYSTQGLRRLRVAQECPTPTAPPLTQSESPEAPALVASVPLVSPMPLASPVPDEAPPPAPSTSPPSKMQELGARIWQGAKPGGARPVAPFTAAWRGESGDGKADTMQIDELDETEGASYIPMEGSIPATGVMADDSDGSDEWEVEQLRRSGVSEVSAIANEKLSQLGRIIRAAEEKTDTSDGVGACRAAMRAAKKECAARAKHATERLGRVDIAEVQCRKAARAAEGDIEVAKRRLIFYDGLTAHVEDVCDMLSEKHDVMLAFRDAVISNLCIEADAVAAHLGGGVDEFGRSRRPALDANMEVAEIAAPTDVLIDVDDNVRSIPVLIERFRAWKVAFPQDYEAAFGNASLGKLAGTLGLAEGNADWLRCVGRGCVPAACAAGRLDGLVAAYVRARWKPRSEDSCREVGVLSKAVVAAGGVEVVECLRERLRLEMTCCEEVGNGEAAGECVIGGIRICKQIGQDVGLTQILSIARRVCSGISKEMESELRWVVAGGVVDDGGAQVAQQWLHTVDG